MLESISLNGAWQCSRVNGPERIIGSVPGDVYGDLLAANIIEDPYYRDNEERLQWIGESDWQYERTFEVTSGLLQHDKVWLRCHGLDTFATIRLNGQELARTDNMFRVWEWDVKRFLKVGENTISVLFASTLPYCRENQRKKPMNWWGFADIKEKAGWHGWVRKQQCNFGWDWGLKAVTCGIWRDIELVAASRARLDDIMIAQHHRDTMAVDLEIAMTIQRFHEVAVHATVQLYFEDQLINTATIDPSEGGASVTLHVPEPKLWWPHNLGSQPLYDLSVELTDSATGTVLDRHSKRIGLRTFRLDRHPDQWGESFQFTVNGVPFFAKGANWIPADGILARMTPQRYRDLVADAAAANMNMLRVWGGGVYEHRAFYEACDEIGICVWQDFMFACTTYPLFDDAFVASVEAEARDMVRRLRDHACLALWCGNNELEQGLAGDRGWEGGQMPWADYSRVFDKLLGDIVSQVDPQTAYWPGSPHSPHGDRRDYNNPECGDAHLWGVWHNRHEIEWYRSCSHRFVSEFGFQSFPEPRTVNGFTVPDDRNVTSWIMEHHQRSGAGNANIMHYMLAWFKMPLGFENTLWMSQILQAFIIQYACEHFRRSLPRCMGILYWQLNDTWPAPSWSSIDYHGRWKALHYVARRFFSPMLVSSVEDSARATVELHITNDSPDDQPGVLKWRITDVYGSDLECGELNVIAAAQADTASRVLELSHIVSQVGARRMLIWMDWEVNDQTVSSNLTALVRPKHLELNENPGLSATVEQIDETHFQVALSSVAPALWVWLTLSDRDVRWSDNFIHLRSGGTRHIIDAVLSEPLDYSEFHQLLQVRSLVDTWR